jgi:hypothetical protein
MPRRAVSEASVAVAVALIAVAKDGSLVQASGKRLAAPEGVDISIGK